MLCKLAWGNVRRAGKDYLVYLLTLTLGVTVFYAFNTVSLQVDIAGIKSEGLSDLLGTTLSDLTYFLAAVMAFLMVYANNFIMKRRKKEFGLYQVLGMGRGRVSLIMVLETAMVSVAAFAMGMVLGVLLSQLMTFFTASLFKTTIGNFRFFFSWQAFGMTAASMVLTFALTLVFNLRTVRRTKLIELMGAERRNETIKTRRPWIAATLFVVGAVLVGVAYYRLLRDGLPVSGVAESQGAAFRDFGITTAMVTVGTFLLFYGLSGLLIKLVQSLRGVYWRGLNMYTVRQLAAKVNTVSFSMGVISMILFLAITSVTSGMSIASVMNDNLEKNNPVDYSQTYVYNTPENVEWTQRHQFDDSVVLAVPTEPVDLYGAWQGQEWKHDGTLSDSTKNIAEVACEHIQLDTYLSKSPSDKGPQCTLGKICKSLNRTLPSGTSGSNAETIGLSVMRASQYNAFRKMLGYESVDFKGDRYLITSDLGGDVVDLYQDYMAAGKTVTLGTYELKPVSDKIDEGKTAAIANSALGSNPGTVVVPDAIVDELNLEPYNSSLLVNYKKGIDTAKADDYVTYVAIDNIYDAEGKAPGTWGVSIRRTEMVEQAAMMNGLISYLAIYIGFVLVVACAAILSIQQLSSVGDSARSHRVLAEIGCETRRISHSVLAQQAVFFLFPLAVALAHSAVALCVIIDLVSLFGHMSIGGTVGLTCAVFLAAYGGYFLVTYFMSAGMVCSAVATRYSE